jgi:photosystem II stability/assembly factor-like uncharacterized protein
MHASFILTHRLKQLVFFTAILLAFPAAKAQTWTPQNSGVTRDLEAIVFTNDTSGWALGKSSGGAASGTLVRTTRAGQPWGRPQPGISGGTWYDAFFTSSLTGFAAGKTAGGDDEGIIRRTTDGGNTWQVVAADIEEELYAIHFADSLHGWSCGKDGVLLATTDGGLTWAFQQVPEEEDLTGIAALSPLEAVVTAEDGLLFRTQNGGTSWTELPSPTDRDLLAVTLRPSGRGWAVGEHGVLLFTADSGRTWSRQVSGTGNDLTAVQFVNDSTGWVVGKYGTVLVTFSGGRQWAAQASQTQQHILDLAMVNDSTGWFCGQNGIIHRYGRSQTPVTPVQPGTLQALFSTISPAVQGIPHPFADLSTGAVQSWRWDFGDGGTDSVQFPIHTYDSAGIWQVRLIVTDSAGLQDTFTAPLVVIPLVQVQVSPNPSPVPSGILLIQGAFSGPYSVTLTDLTGAVVANWTNQTGNTFQIPAQSIPPGTYLLTVQLANGYRYSTRWVIQ